MAEDYWSPKSMLTVKPKEAFGDAYICRTSNNKTAYMLSKFRMTQEAKEIHKEEVDAIQKFMSMQHDNLVRYIPLTRILLMIFFLDGVSSKCLMLLLHLMCLFL